MTKSELRVFYKEKRKRLSASDVEGKSLNILDNIQKLPIWEHFVYHCFLPIEAQREIQTSHLINLLWKHNKKTVVPKVQGADLLVCEFTPESELEVGKFQVPEPVNCTPISFDAIDVVFVPLLICDLNGNRIGYGGGFYDRFLSKLKPDTLKIGLNYFNPILTKIEAEATDIPLDFCISPQEIFEFPR